MTVVKICTYLIIIQYSVETFFCFAWSLHMHVNIDFKNYFPEKIDIVISCLPRQFCLFFWENKKKQQQQQKTPTSVCMSSAESMLIVKLLIFAKFTLNAKKNYI